MQVGVEFQEPKNKWDINTILKLSVAVAVLLIGLSIAYYFVIYIPSKDKAKEKEMNFQRYYNQVRYNACIEGAEEAYHQRWQGYCNANKLGKDCSIPVIFANDFQEQLRKDKEECRRVHLE
jgi:hypothetical protein